VIDEFFRAASDGDLETLSRFPELVNIRHQGASALHVAAIEGQMDAVRWLLEQGAVLDTKDDEFGMTPAAWANEKGRTAVVEFLLSEGALITPHEAAGFGKLERLQEFARADPSVLAREEQWGTPVHSACIWGRPEVLEWLIAQGADIRKRSRQGQTPLDIAEHQSKNGRSHTPIVLEERKAELERECARIAARLRGLVDGA